MADNIYELPVKSVTLFEDRARIVRKGPLVIPEGAQRVRIEGVSPTIADKTLSAKVHGDASLADIAVRRSLRQAPGKGEGARAELEREQEAVERELQRLADDATALKIDLGRTVAAAELAIAELSNDVSWGQDVAEDFTETLATLHERQLRQRMDLASLELTINDKQEEYDRLLERLASLNSDEDELTCALEIQLRCGGGDVSVEIEYMVPGACWRPYHRATLTESESRVVFETDACVWQNTGEDWRDAELRFSTERTSVSTRPPSLDSDILALQKKSSQTVVEAREQEVQTTGLGGGDRRISELPGIDDAGECVHLELKGTATVHSNGRPHRFNLTRCESETQLELVAFPELSPHVHFKCTLTNENPVPLLAGPVDLIRESGLVGRTSILYVASGERFEIGWGPQPDLRIKRMHEESREKSKMLSSWVVENHRIELFVSNLADVAHSIRITERIPVSETDKVRVELESDDEPTSADDDGFISWDVEIGPHGGLKRTLRYQLKKRDDVVGI